MKKLLLNILLTLFLSFLLLPAHAIEEKTMIKTPKKVFTINDCIDYAMEHDNDLKVSKEEVKVQKSKVGQAKSSYFPTLGFGTGYTFTNNNSKETSTTNNAYKLNASVNQLIWDFGKTAAKINMNKYNLLSSKMDMDFHVLLIIYDVKISYYKVLASKAYVDIAERTVMINKLNYERTKALFETGLKSKIDVVNSEVNYTDAKIQLLEAQQAYEESLVNLADAMTYTDGVDFGVTPTENFNFKPIHYNPMILDTKTLRSLQNGEGTELVLTSGIEKHDILKDFDFKPCEITVKEAFETAIKNRPDLKSMDLVAKAANESLKALKREYYPKLNASAGYGYGLNQVNYSNNFQVYAGLDFPEVNIMNIKTKIDEGKSLYNIALENYNITKNSIYFDIQNTYIAMKKLEKRIPLMAQKVNQTLENFELADGRYTVGLGNFIELQDAQINYNNAQLEFVQVVFKYNVAREEFLKSMGVQ